MIDGKKRCDSVDLKKRGKNLPNLSSLSYAFDFFSRGHATLHLAVSVCRYVGKSVCRSVRRSICTFLNSERFSHYCSYPTVRDWIAVYPALFSLRILNTLKSVLEDLQKKSWFPVYPFSLMNVLKLKTTRKKIDDDRMYE